MFCYIVVVCIFITASGCNRSFPPGFKFGAATSAYQIEGGWNVSDKSPSIWDVYYRSHVSDRTGNVACDSYHLWKEDVEAAKQLGVDFYRFSVAWTRILPSGFSDRISDDGSRYYSVLIDALLEAGIEPVITLYHWDLPQTIQDLGGWTNPLIADWFADYAKVVFSLYADRVKTWITLNEPLLFCEMTYSMGSHPPAIHSPGLGDFMCVKNSMIAHAKAWRIYDEQFKPRYHGRVSLTNQVIWYEPETPEDEELSELALQMGVGIYSHPIYSEKGGWPPKLEEYLQRTRDTPGYPPSVLPKFTKEEIELVRGTYDYFGINYYTSRLVRRAADGETVGPRPLSGIPELRAVLTRRPDWQANHQWFYINPIGIRKILNWIKKEYGDMEILIFENGHIKTDTSLNDPDRIQVFKVHLEQVLLAIYEDDINVGAYTAWSLMDNYEWTDGYNANFGLYAVDFSDPLRKRTPRSSAHYYGHVVRNRTLDVPEHYVIYGTNRAVTLYLHTCISYMVLTFLLV